MILKDSRIKLVNEILNGIRVRIIHIICLVCIRKSSTCVFPGDKIVCMGDPFPKVGNEEQKS